MVAFSLGMIEIKFRQWYLLIKGSKLANSVLVKCLTLTIWKTIFLAYVVVLLDFPVKLLGSHFTDPFDTI
jgi:hypothetical protein